MNKLEQAARQALEALEVSTDWDVGARGKQLQSMKAITALREALAEQDDGSVCGRCGGIVYDPVFKQAEQEPVGVVTKDSLDGVVKWNGWIPREGTKIYAAPVRTKDLTDDEIHKAFYSKNTGLINGIRAVIAADRERNK